MKGLYWWYAAVGVDRFTMTKSKIKVGEWKAVVACMMHIWKKRHELLPDGKMKLVMCAGKPPRLFWHSTKNGHRTFELSLGTTKQSYRYFQITSYPGWFTATSLARFQGVTDPLLKHLSYDSLFASGHVTYIEFAVDFASFRREDIMLMREKVSTSYVYKGLGGDLGTLYLGSTQSSRRDRMYDKARQMKEKWSVTSPHATLTRIEVALRRTGLPANELLKLPNPFKGLRVLIVETTKSAASDQHWKSFVTNCVANGIPTALKTTHGAERIAFRKRLLANAVTSWQTEQVWKRCLGALQAITPVVLA